jgi:hypothetical protein
VSRFTFRPSDHAVAWQRQIRDKYLSEGTPPVPHLDVKRAQVKPVTRALATQIILKYEWLGNMSPTFLHFGLFFGMYCAGVTCVGNNTSTAGVTQHQKFGIEAGALLTLARGACVHWAPVGANSKLVSWTCRLLANMNAGKIIVAFADTDAGEIGTIYQACNWVYIGVTKRPREGQIVSPQGVMRDSKFITNHAHKNRTTFSRMRTALLNAGWRFQSSNPKHRYVYVLDRADSALMARVEHMRQPYPKRATSIASDARSDQGREGGATPTVALKYPER